MQRNRWAYAGWIAAVIAAGLASRSPRASFLPEFLTAYAGDTLWALIVFLILGFVFPRGRTATLAVAALGISFAVEFSGGRDLSSVASAKEEDRKNGELGCRGRSSSNEQACCRDQAR